MALETITLEDETSGARARVLPGLGFNCYSFEASSVSGPVAMLWAAADFTSGEGRASGSGIPLLFPFPGRIRQGRFRFGGREFSIPAGDGRGNAIHGFVLNRPWRIVEQSNARVAGEFQPATDDPSILEHWPADFRLRVTYSVAGGALAASIEVENPADVPLPFGFGAHPYFRLPLGGQSTAEQCRVTVPVTQQWELIDLLPTGQSLPVEEDHTLRAGGELNAEQFDSVFSGVQFTDGQCAARIDDPAAGRSLSIRFDDNFAHCVVYTPPHREAICIEPYTCVPDAFWLEEQGVPSGLRVLAPGGAFRCTFAVRLERFRPDRATTN